MTWGLNKAFENQIDTAAMELIENAKNYQEILSIHHTDADGISSGEIIRKMVARLKVPFRQQSNNLDLNWGEYLEGVVTPKTPMGIIFSDCAPAGTEITAFLAAHPEVDIYILDHHYFRPDPDNPLPDNVYNCNPTEFGLHGLKEIIGATLNYVFARAVDERNKAYAWIATIGMGGDVLDHFNDYQSYNKLVVEEAAELEQIIINDGLCAFGGQYERVDKGLSLSILPFVSQVGGDWKTAQTIIKGLNIPPSKKIEDLTESEVDSICTALDNPNLKGKYITYPKKQGLLHFQFEHAHLISILGHEKPSTAFQLLGAPRANKEQKEAYLTFMQGIVANLTAFVSIPKIETKSALIVNLTGKVPSSMWSNTGSFATINGIYDSNKVLLIGGVDGESMKFSVRCSKEFIANHGGAGANVIIKKITEKLGGTGGGHGLAGGLRIDPKVLDELTKEIDSFI